MLKFIFEFERLDVNVSICTNKKQNKRIKKFLLGFHSNFTTNLSI